ncbi:MAG: hypothetical protein HY842_17440 [Bacteroidetes bacterium]|nr:hypothetical protein [Bacteroidota bacterium]
MEKKIILGTLAGAATGIILSMVIFMVFLGSMMEKWLADNAACIHEPSMMWWIIASLVFSLFVSILLHKFGVNTFKGGATAGAWITFLIALWFGITNASSFKAYTWDWLPIDLAMNTVIGAVAGGVIGWIFGKVK